MVVRNRRLVAGGIGVGVLLAGLGAGVIGPAFLGFENAKRIEYMVKLVPQGASGELKVDKKNKCRKGKHKGCLLFEVDKVGLITFYLSGSRKKVKNCSNATEVITRIEITTTGEDNNPDASKGDFDRTSPLPLWVKTNAFTNINLKTGIVYEATEKNGLTQVIRLNQNSHDQKIGERRFWYRVTATDCETPANTWTTDPRGDNEGTHF